MPYNLLGNNNLVFPRARTSLYGIDNIRLLMTIINNDFFLRRRRPSYYGDLFICNDQEVDDALQKIYNNPDIGRMPVLYFISSIEYPSSYFFVQTMSIFSACAYCQKVHSLVHQITPKAISQYFCCISNRNLLQIETEWRRYSPVCMIYPSYLK